MPERARQPGPGKPAPPLHRGPSAPPHGDRQGGTRNGAFLEPLELQSLAGNRAVGLIVDQIAQRALQRVAVKETPPDETLYNQQGTGGKGGAAKFGGEVAYDMARSGDAGITVTVRIQFLSQLRNGVDPSSPGAPPGTPPLGTLLNNPTEIPVNDPDDRRKWCQDIVREQVKPWNGRLSLLGEEVNVFSKNTQKRLPVTFNSVAVFGLGDKYDQRIIVHPKSTRADRATGNPIDAGNYYLNKGDYSADDEVIAAHEYGHLLGIDDEYSQSNEMLNGLLHQAAPKNAPSAMAAVDKKTVETMVLASLKRPLLDQLTATVPAVTDAFRAKRATVKAKMAAAARSGVVEPAVRGEVEKQLIAASEPGLAPSIPRVVAFESTKNFSNLTAAGEGVDAGFDAAKMASRIVSMYEVAIGTAQGTTINLPGVGDTRITVQSSVPAMTAAGGPSRPTRPAPPLPPWDRPEAPARSSGCR